MTEQMVGIYFCSVKSIRSQYEKSRLPLKITFFRRNISDKVIAKIRKLESFVA